MGPPGGDLLRPHGRPGPAPVITVNQAEARAESGAGRVEKGRQRSGSRWGQAAALRRITVPVTSVIAQVSVLAILAVTGVVTCTPVRVLVRVNC
jgi:hypothetical protein